MTVPSACRGPVCREPARCRRVAAAALLGFALLSVAACTSGPNSIAGQAKAGDNKGFVAGDGTVEQLAVPQRGAPLQLTGTTVTGAAWSMATDAGGKVAVINVWGSWCGPSVEEAPHLQKVWATDQSAKKPVTFIGIDINESSATGRASWVNGVTYPRSTSRRAPPRRGSPFRARRRQHHDVGARPARTHRCPSVRGDLGRHPDRARRRRAGREGLSRNLIRRAPTC